MEVEAAWGCDRCRDMTPGLHQTGIDEMGRQAVLTVIRLLDIDAMLAKRKTQVIHRQNDAIPINPSTRTTPSGRSSIHAQLGEVVRITRQIRNKLLCRQRQKTFSFINIDHKASLTVEDRSTRIQRVGGSILSLVLESAVSDILDRAYERLVSVQHY